MKKIVSVIGAAVLSAALLATSAVPTTAAPIRADGYNAGIVLVHDRDHRRGRHHYGFQRRGNFYFFNGFRGYRERRHGYRKYRGYWFPPSAFSFSFSVGGGYHHPYWW